jgi:hypothetical protein
MLSGEDWWDRDPEWRDLAYACTSVQSRCVLCGVKARSLQAVPVNRSDPFGDLLAVCGQCKVAARRFPVIPEGKVVADPTVGPLMAHQIVNTKWRTR